MTRKKDRCPKDSSQVTALCNKINEMASSMWPFICQAIQTTEKIFFTHKVLFTDLCIITTSYSLKQWKQYAIPLGPSPPPPHPGATCRKSKPNKTPQVFVLQIYFLNTHSTITTTAKNKSSILLQQTQKQQL